MPSEFRHLIISFYHPRLVVGTFITEIGVKSAVIVPKATYALVNKSLKDMFVEVWKWRKALPLWYNFPNFKV